MPLRFQSLLVLLLALGIGLGSSSAYGQRTSGAVGLGGQIGEPTGVTLKFFNEDSPSYDFLAAWDLEEFFFLNAHALFENDIETENLDQDLEWFVGPGGFIGFFDRPGSEAGVGISGTIGMNLVFDRRVELYGQLTPRLGLIPDTDGTFGGGAGVRFYF